MKMARVDAAEKEASEVLHSLLSVERIEKVEVIDRKENASPNIHSFETTTTTETSDVDGQIQWHAPVSIATHSIFTAMEANNQFPQTIDEHQVVIWEGHPIQVDTDQSTIYTATPVEEEEPQQPIPSPKRPKPKTPPKSKVKVPVKKKKKGLENPGNNDPTKLEESAAQVKERFKRGCECQDESCFRGLNPESVYKHRLNIAELTKGEHDMYLMGVTMACLANPDITVRHKERRRLRAQYVYQGRRVCLDAFLYLENCTHYQLKRIRKHVMTHGVAPRIHGNHGKKPHNTFSLDIYRHATEFLKQYLEKHTGESGVGNSKQPIQLPWDITRKNLHDAYKECVQLLEPGIKLMGYSTFRHFMKEQFPHVKFCKVEPKSAAPQSQQQQQQVQQQNHAEPQHQIQQHQITTKQIQQQPREQQIQKCVINNEVQQVIPLVVTPNDGGASQHHQQAFLVTPVPQIIPNGNIVTQTPNNHVTGNTFSYQLANTGYVINEQDDGETPFEEIEMQNTVQTEPLGVHDVAELLHPQYAIITGGKSREGCPLITFPDQNNFNTLTDIEYQRLMLYLTSVPSLQEADLGFHLIIDRRKDRWNSVKTVLLKISVYFPGLIHVVYVIRPASFIQKALSEVSNKLFKDEFKFRMIVLSTEEELHEYVDTNQLTVDLGGSLPYCHVEWIQQRVDLEKFSARTHEVSNALDEFTKRISETEFPNNVDSTQQLLNQQSLEYSQLKEEILTAAKHGEGLLGSIREKSSTNSDSTFNHSADTIGNVFAVERLLVQLEETERTFDEFWAHHSTKLRHCLELRRFEQDFRELQVNFDSHLKTVSEMTEVGETVKRVDTLIRETGAFEKLCKVDIDRAEEVIASGHQLLQIKNSCPLECVEPKCNELMRVREILTGRLNKRMETLVKCRDLMEQIEKANQWCAKGVELLASQGIEKCSNSVELAEKSLFEIQAFVQSADEFNLNSAKDFKHVFQESITPETKALVTQVLQRIDDVSLMCEKRITSLKKVTVRPPRPIQTVTPEPAVPRQPSIGAPMPQRIQLKKANTISKMESSGGTNSVSSDFTDTSTPDFDLCQDDIQKVKQGHVLSELLETEKIYVTELASIIKGYKMEATSKEMMPLLPIGLLDKLDILFGNIDDIYNFHANVFLKDLENCISSIDLVALCFVQKRDLFYQLYSYYCQNIPRSEQLRETLVDNNQFFQACQRKLGHKLPLAAYLLKPVQRITKYQLLLGDLLKYCDDSNSCKELQGAVDCMLIVLKCVNDSMLQICITGFPFDLSQQGDLLLQGLFSVWAENKKDIRLRIKPMQRHIFLYQKAMLFCKAAAKTAHNKSNFQFKHYLKMSQIGLTESVKGDAKKFEVWLQGRQEVYTIQASTVEQKQSWVNEIKRVLLNQLEELKGEKIKQYSILAHKHLRQTASWETRQNVPNLTDPPTRAMSCDVDTRSYIEDEALETMEAGSWSSDCSNSDEEDTNQAVPSGRYIALADYCAVGSSEVSMREGDIVELLKVGCAGWWFVKVVGTTIEGWAPAAYLENLHRKTSRSSSRSQDRLNDH